MIDAFNFNYLVNYAVGIRTLGELNLAERTLYNFRLRLYEYISKNPEAEEILFRQFLTLTENFADVASVKADEQRSKNNSRKYTRKKANEIIDTADRFLKEQSKYDVISLGRKSKKNKEITPNSLQSVHDKDSTYRKKGKVSQSGYVLEISETCNEDNPF